MLTIEQREAFKQYQRGEIELIHMPTDGETFFYKNENTPLVSLGRIPGAEGLHVLQQDDGKIICTGGAYLRRPGEEWYDLADAIKRDSEEAEEERRSSRHRNR